MSRTGNLKKRIKDQLCLFQIRHSEFFWEDWYRQQANLPPSADAAKHYYEGGWRQLDPSPRFRRELYWQSNPDVLEADICPLAHYLFYGKRHRRVRYPGMLINHYHGWPVTRGFLRVLFETLNLQRIRRNRDARILIIVHIYYEDSIREIIQYLKNFRKYQYDLIVTTVDGPDAEEISDRMWKFDPRADIRIYPNRGFDIGPFWQATGECDLSRYDMVFKLQSKRHFSREGCSAAGMYIRGRDWFLYLFRAVAGARWIHRNIDRLHHDLETELVAARNLLQQDPPFKERIAIRTLAEKGVTLPKGYSFVAGSCFGIKAETLKKIRAVPLEASVFEEARRGKFTMAHALERYISGSVPAEKQVGNEVCVLRQRRNRKVGEKTIADYWARIALAEKYGLRDEFTQDYMEGHQIYSSCFFLAKAGRILTERRNGRWYAREAAEGAWLRVEEAAAGPRKADLVINHLGVIVEGAEALAELKKDIGQAGREMGILYLETDILDSEKEEAE